MSYFIVTKLTKQNKKNEKKKMNKQTHTHTQQGNGKVRIRVFAEKAHLWTKAKPPEVDEMCDTWQVFKRLSLYFFFFFLRIYPSRNFALLFIPKSHP